jgi:hypothetical protein
MNDCAILLTINEKCHFYEPTIWRNEGRVSERLNFNLFILELQGSTLVNVKYQIVLFGMMYGYFNTQRLLIFVNKLYIFL